MYLTGTSVPTGVEISRGFNPNEGPLARQIHEFGLKEIYLRANHPAADAKLDELVANRFEREAAFRSEAMNRSLVARMSGHMVGFVAIDSAIGERKIRGISTISGMRDLGIGRSLMERAIKEATLSATLAVELDEFTVVNAGFFKGFGFQEDGVRAEDGMTRLVLPSRSQLLDR